MEQVSENISNFPDQNTTQIFHTTNPSNLFSVIISNFPSPQKISQIFHRLRKNLKFSIDSEKISNFPDTSARGEGLLSYEFQSLGLPKFTLATIVFQVYFK